MVSSSTVLRRTHYDAFYALHVLLFPIMLSMSALHHPETGWWAWAALILWVLERIWRCGRTLRLNWRRPLRCNSGSLGTYNAATEKKSLIASGRYMPPPGFAHAELLSGATLRLTYMPVRTVRWAPGQHFLLSIPAVSKLNSHPFTCATFPLEADSPLPRAAMVFIIRAKYGWTKQLWDLIVSLTAEGKMHIGGESHLLESAFPPSGLLLRTFIDGPFGSSVRIPWQDHSSVLIIAAGSGVTFGLSVLSHLCCVFAAAGRTGELERGTLPSVLRRIRFVWLVREFGNSIPDSCRNTISSVL